MNATDVKQTIALTSTAALQKYVKTVATNIGPARIKAIQAQASTADASVKIYDDTSAGTASNLVFEAKWGINDGDIITFYLPQDGIRCKTAMWAVMSNCDFLVVTFD